MSMSLYLVLERGRLSKGLLPIVVNLPSVARKEKPGVTSTQMPDMELGRVWKRVLH